MNFENIMESWKAASPSRPPEFFTSSNGEGSLFDKIKEIERKRKKQLIRMFITMPLTLAVLWVVMLTTKLAAPLTFAGFALLNVAIIGIVAAVYTSKVPVSTRSIESPPAVFLEKVLKRLKLRKVITVYLMPLYGLLITGGIYLMYIEILAGATTGFKVMVYSAVLIYCIAMLTWGIRKELKRYKKDVEPVLTDIKTTLNLLKGQ